MKTSDFNYELPEGLIAQEPAKERDQSRLMVIGRADQNFKHNHFYDIVDYLGPGDLLVLNDTKVIPANLVGEKVNGGAKVEVLLVRKQGKDENRQIWKCLVRPGKRLNVGSEISFRKGMLKGKVLEKLESGEQIVEFESAADFWYIIHKLGKLPLPPYISPKDNLLSRYQTIYASKEGASAAPTAGLHFTSELLEKLIVKGIKIAYLTLHTGLATFLPVRTERLEDHEMHLEYYDIPQETIEALQAARRVIAVGTTTVRALESASVKDWKINKRISGETGLFITPGYRFKVVDAIITNFHWPRSTLIMLVSAFAQEGLGAKSIFAGRDFIMRAYQEAIKQNYRFYSFGDAMLIL